MNWEKEVAAVTPHVVKITHPGGWGTGFLAFYNHNKSWCGIATAAHVVSHAEQWQQPIRISHEPSGTTEFFSTERRVIFVNHQNDSAVIVCLKGQLGLPEIPIALIPVGTQCRIGSAVGWLGYPSIEPNTLCFFSGAISASREGVSAYLIDGVGIQGVSGGPVFHCVDSKVLQIIGCVSAYFGGQTTPGLLKAQDVSWFHDTAETVRNIDEANQRKAEFDAAQRAASASGQAGTAPSSPEGL